MMTLGPQRRRSPRRAVRARARGRAQGGRDLARLHARPRHPHQSEESRSSAIARSRSARTTSRGSGDAIIRDAAGRGHRRVRQALSRARRHEHRLAPRAAAHRASARSLDAVELVPFRAAIEAERRLDHDGAHPDPALDEERPGDAVAGDRRRPAEDSSSAIGGLVLSDDLEMKAISRPVRHRRGDGAGDRGRLRCAC